MSLTILITGATNGIGKAAAEEFVRAGHRVLVHGRNEQLLKDVYESLKNINPSADVTCYQADFSDLTQVKKLADDVRKNETHLDVLINNAGVYMTPTPLTNDQLDVRFVVNTFAPYLLTKELISLMNESGRVVNVSSRAQATVDVEAMVNGATLAPDVAYAQSKLALTMLSMYHAKQFSQQNGPSIIAINPKSFIGTNMVREAYGMEGHDIKIGADILYRAALSNEFDGANGKFYDNDAEKFDLPHPDARNSELNKKVVQAIEALIEKLI